MFFQLPEIERIESRAHQLGKQKQQLQSNITRAYSKKNKVQVSVNVTIDGIIESAKSNLAIISNIEDEAENGFLVPEEFDIADLVYDKAHLPEWFQFVFKKQFAKQKKNFDIASKKLYAQNFLPQKKNELCRQIKSFQTLYERYKVLEGTEKYSLNIMTEAQTLKNKSQNIMSKFLAYLMLITSKINSFVDENVEKSLNYAHKNDRRSQPQILYRIPHKFPHQQEFESRIPFERNMQRYGNQQIYTKSNESNPTMAQFYPIRQPPIYHKSRLITSSPFSHQGHGHGFGSCQNHRGSVKTTGFEADRHNYREHLPRWMNKTLSDYYF